MKFYIRITFLFLVSSITVRLAGQCVQRIDLDTDIDLRTLFFQQPGRGYVAGDGGFLQFTGDDGESWVQQDLRTNQSINELFFTDDTIGWAVGNLGTIRFTEDGGTNWRQQYSPQRIDLHSVSFSETGVGVIAGACGTILRTTDGINWATIPPVSPNDLFKVHFIDETTVLAVGAGGLVLRSENAGISWGVVNSGTNNDLFGLSNFGASVWASGQGGGHLSEDAGITWTEILLSNDYFDVAAMGSQKVLWVGEGGRILETLAGGTSFTDLSIPAVAEDLLAIMLPDSTTGYAVGEGGTLVRIFFRDAMAQSGSPVCVNDTIALIGTFNGLVDSIRWSGPEGFSSTAPNPVLPSATAGMAGIYTYEVNQGECIFSDTTLVEVFANPNASFQINPTTLCVDDQLVVTYSGNAGPDADYTWDFDGGEALFDTNSGSLIISWPEVGHYTIHLLVIAENGCQAQSSATVEVNGTQIEIGNEIAICDGESISLDAGNDASSYLWSTGATSPTISIDTPGDYGVTVTSADGCLAEDQVSVYAIDLIESLTGTAATCDQPNGLAQLELGDTSGNVAIAWSDGSSGLTQIDNLAPGTYTVTVTDEQCTQSASVSVPAIPGPSVNIIPFGTTCAGVPFTLQAEVQNCQGCNFTWSNGDSGNSLVVMEEMAGFYQYNVTVNDANGCFAQAYISVEISDAQVDLEDNAALCNGESIILDAGPGAATYSWSTGASTQTITVDTPGNYSVVITTPEGCTAQDQASIPSVDLIATINASPATCGQPNGGVLLQLGEITGDYTINWSNGVSGADQITSLAPGNYSVTVSDEWCTQTATTTVNAVMAPGVAIVPPSVTCAGDPFVLQAEVQNCAGCHYEWSNGSTDDTVTVTETIAGTYSYAVTITDANGCPASAPLLVDITDAVVVLPEDLALCNGASIPLDAGPNADDYSWSTGADTQMITVSNAGTYGVTITTAAGCTAQGQVSISEVALIQALTTEPATCDQPNGTALIQLGETTGDFSIDWSNGEVGVTQITNLTPGNYSVTVTDHLCSENATIAVTAETAPSVTLDAPTTACAGTALTLTAEAQNCSGCNYSWSTGDTGNPLTVTETLAGTFTYSVTITDASGCVAEDSDSFTLIDLQEPFLPEAIDACANTSIPLNAGNPDAAYQWSTGSTAQAINITTSGSYSVTVTAGNCTIQDEVNITIFPPNLTNLNEAICQGQSYDFGGEEIEETGEYQIVYTGANNCDSIVNLLLTVDAPLTGMFTDTVCTGELYNWNGTTYTDPGTFMQNLVTEENCDSMVTLTLFHLPAPDILDDPPTLYNSCEGESLPIISLQPTPGAIIDWYGSALGNDTIIVGSNTLTPTSPGVFFAEARNLISGCRSLSRLMIEVVVNPDEETYLQEQTCRIADAGTTIDTAVTVNGCTNLIFTERTFVPAYDTTFVDSLSCMHSEIGVVSQLFTSTDNCDSIVVRETRFDASRIGLLPDRTTCDPELVRIDTTFLSGAGQDGCDSLQIQRWMLEIPPQNNIAVTICEGEDYLFGDTLISESGIYQDTLFNSEGCDSIVSLALSVASLTLSTVREVKCQGDTYLFGDSLITDAGEYLFVLENQAGCDSTVLLILEYAEAPTFLPVDDTLSIIPGSAITSVNVAANDQIPAGANWWIQPGKPPEHGTVSFLTEVFLGYTLFDPDFFGTDSLTYLLCSEFCQDTSCIEATVRVSNLRDCSEEIEDNLPTGFTPDGDGINDHLDPIGGLVELGCIQHPKNATLTIINRWNEIIYEAREYRPWDGRFRTGERVSQGVYFYILTFEEQNEYVFRKAVNVLW